MGKITYPHPVKLIFSIISTQEFLFQEAKNRLMNLFGKIDMESKYQSFDYTDYYQEELGEDLQQLLVSFEKLVIPDRLSQIKFESNQLEITLSKNDHQGKNVSGIKRKVNFDPGYLTLGKFILASTKNGPARIYLQRGIYAEITLQFFQKSFQPLRWTYLNYRTETYIHYFNQVREKYKEDLRAFRKSTKKKDFRV